MVEDDKPVCGPVCEMCGKSRQWLVPLLVRREKHGRFEMVKVHLCLYHFFSEIERSEEEPMEEEPKDDDDDDEDEEGWV